MSMFVIQARKRNYVIIMSSRSSLTKNENEKKHKKIASDAEK